MDLFGGKSRHQQGLKDCYFGLKSSGRRGDGVDDFLVEIEGGKRRLVSGRVVLSGLYDFLQADFGQFVKGLLDLLLRPLHILEPAAKDD